MTNKEATKIRSAFDNGFEYPFGDGDIHACNIGEVNHHAKLLDEALKKQIPKKPNVVTVEKYKVSYECPRCGQKHVNEWCGPEWKLPFCSTCGQALDWNDIGE